MMPAIDTRYTGAAMDSLRRIVRALRAGHLAARGLGVSTAQLFVLKVIGANSGLSLAEVCEHTATVQSSASEVVARLVDRGLVVRETDLADRRCVRLMLTDAGQVIVDHTPETVQEQLVAGYENLSDDEQAALARGLEAWTRASGLSALPATMFLEPS